MSYTFKLTSLIAQISNGGKKVLTFKEVDAAKALAEVVDCLLSVEWLDGPNQGKKGKLLISHGCRWPEDLAVKADWLEGCNTPFSASKYQHKLVLVPHPKEFAHFDMLDFGVFQLLSLANPEQTASLKWKKLLKVVVVTATTKQVRWVENLWKFHPCLGYYRMETGGPGILFVQSTEDHLPHRVLNKFLKSHPRVSAVELGFTVAE